MLLFVPGRLYGHTGKESRFWYYLLWPMSYPCYHSLGIDVKIVQEIPGHYSAAFTMDVYSNVTDKMRREAADRVGNLLASLTK